VIGAIEPGLARLHPNHFPLQPALMEAGDSEGNDPQLQRAIELRPGNCPRRHCTGGPAQYWDRLPASRNWRQFPIVRNGGCWRANPPRRRNPRRYCGPAGQGSGVIEAVGKRLFFYRDLLDRTTGVDARAAR